jgi:hypothetical protein
LKFYLSVAFNFPFRIVVSLKKNRTNRKKLKSKFKININYLFNIIKVISLKNDDLVTNIIKKKLIAKVFFVLVLVEL